MVSGLSPAGTVSPSGLERLCRSSRSQPPISNAAVASRTNLARQGEDIENASWRRFAWQILDGIDEAECASRVAGVELGVDDAASPSADACHHGDILAPVRTAIADRLTDDPAACLELPQQLAVASVDRLEPAVQSSVENESAAGCEGGAPERQVLVNFPGRASRDRIPRRYHAAITSGTAIHLHVRAHERRARNVVRWTDGHVHAQVDVRNVDETGYRAERRRIPILLTWRGRADVAHDPSLLRFLFGIGRNSAGLEIDPEIAIHMAVRGRRQYLPGAPVHHVEEPVATWPQEHRAAAVAPWNVGQNRLVDVVVVVNVVRRRLVKPQGVAAVDVAGENARRPFIVAGPLVGVPRARIARPIINCLGSRVVADPAPHIAAAELPDFRWPRFDAEVLALVHGVERLEPGTNQNVLVGPSVVGFPSKFSAAFVEGSQPPANAHFAARISDQHFSVGDERRHRQRLALLDVC